MAVFKRKREPSSDPREFERLYRESFNSVYSFVRYRMLDEEAARDVTAESFLKAARYFDGFDPSRASFTTWVKAIAHNCMVDYYRRNRQHTPIEDVPEAFLADGSNVERDTVNEQLAKRLLSCLGDEDREIVRLKFYEGLSNIEIAREIGMNPSTVATRVQRALAKMRKAAG